MLVAERDAWRVPYALGSLFFHLHHRCDVMIFQDGSLTNRTSEYLRHFPDVHIFNYSRVHGEVVNLLKRYPSLLSFRTSEQSHKLKHKLDCLLLSPFKTTLYLDSDVLFINKPTMLESVIKSGKFAHGRYPQSIKALFREANNPEFILRKALAVQLDLDMNSFFNSGLLLYGVFNHNDIVRAERLAECFSNIGYADMLLAEEMLMSAFFAKKKVAELASDAYLTTTVKDQFFKHYTGRENALHFAYQTKQLFVHFALKEFVKTKNWSNW